MKRPLTFILSDGAGATHQVTIDWRDAPRVFSRRWHVHQSRSHKYVRANGSSGIMLHRFILEVDDPDVVVDHRDGNTFDNRRRNLRPATKSQNAHNTRLNRRGKTSRYRGVTLQSGRWRASIQCDGKPRYLGLFDTEREAAEAYNAAAIKLFGPCAKLNRGKWSALRSLEQQPQMEARP